MVNAPTVQFAFDNPNLQRVNGTDGPVSSKRTEQQRKQDKSLKKALRFHGHILLVKQNHAGPVIT
jgi:hypothetical protein